MTNFKEIDPVDPVDGVALRDFKYTKFNENTYEVEYGYVIPGHLLEYGATANEQELATRFYSFVAIRVIHQFHESFMEMFHSASAMKIEEARGIPKIYQDFLIKAVYGENAKYLKPSGTYANNFPAVGRHFASIRHFVEVETGTMNVVKDWFVVSFGEFTNVGSEFITKILIEMQEIGK